MGREGVRRQVELWLGRGGGIAECNRVIKK